MDMPTALFIVRGSFPILKTSPLGEALELIVAKIVEVQNTSTNISIMPCSCKESGCCIVSVCSKCGGIIPPDSTAQ